MKQSRRILVLDDDPDVASIISATARSFGYDVLTVCNPLAAVAAVRGWQPAVVVLDLSMRFRDGIEVIHDLASERHPFSLVLISGLGSKVLEAARAFAKLRGFHVNGVLAKPFCRSELKRALATECGLPVESSDECSSTLNPTDDELRCAIERNEFQLFYQPTVKVSDLSLIGAEALVRWQHPQRGLLLPGSFIECVRNRGFMGQLTDRVLHIALTWLKSTADIGTNLAVNITASDLSDVRFVDSVLESCTQLGVDPRRLTLELTESSAVNHSSACLEVLTRFRIHGVRLAIDDFGTGHSTLKQLSALPFCEIKIDRSFVQGVRSNFESLAIVESTIRLGKDLGMITVAEGVEDHETLSILRALGCEWAQGYLFSRPIPDVQIRELISNQLQANS